MFDKTELLGAFPAPSYRKYQKESIIKIAEGFNSEIRCVLLDAPTGYGKSIVNTVFCRLMESFYSTPQLALIDQIREDKIIGRYFTEIKGRQNYPCKFDPAATCANGVCYRKKDFEDCIPAKHCPYWMQKLKALERRTVICSFAYLVLEGMSDTQYSFGRRTLLVLDEAHDVDQHVINHVNLTVSPWTVPKEVYHKVEKEIVEFKSIWEVRDFVGRVSLECNELFEDYEQETLDGSTLEVDEGKDKRKAEDFISKAERFLDLSSKQEWIWELKYSQTSRGMRKRLIISPLYAKLIMPDLVWDKADFFIISSATILDAQRFVDETGLDRVMGGDEILHLKIPSTFPPENRPIINRAVGKMTYKVRGKTLPRAVKELQNIIDDNPGKNIAVHCHSYDLAIAVENLIDKSYHLKMIAHTPEDREEALREWKNSKGKVFLAVAFEEGQDWKGKICEAQVFLKTPYPDIRDRRVARRLELKDFKWYYLNTLRKTIQAYGRAVRSPTEKKTFYVLDGSFWDFMRRCRRILPGWFKEALPEGWEDIP